MQNSKLAKTLLKYALILTVLVATVIGLFIGKGLYATVLVSSSKTPMQLSTEPNGPQLPIILGTLYPCVSVYLSQPPKCKTLDGTFIPLPGTTQFILVTPERK
jgi:hypothetical protein